MWIETAAPEMAIAHQRFIECVGGGEEMICLRERRCVILRCLSAGKIHRGRYRLPMPLLGLESRLGRTDLDNGCS